MKIFPKTVLIVAVTALLPIIIFSVIAYRIAEKTLTQHMLSELEAIASIQEHRVDESISRLKERLNLVRSRTPMLIALERYLQTGETLQKDVAISALQGAKSAISEIRDISIINVKGRVVASTNSALHDKDLSLEEIFIKGMTGFSLDNFGTNEAGEVIMHLSCPVEYHGSLLGVMVVESSSGQIAAITSDYTGLGNTGESLLARKDKDGNALYIVPLRFDQKAALKRKVNKEDIYKPIMQALLKYELVMEDTIDYRGIPVFAAMRYIKETDWGLVVKIDRSEVLKPLVRMKSLFLSSAVASMLVVIVVAFLSGRKFTRPIVKLTNVARKISDGDLQLRSEVTSGDEIGELQQYFNKMTDDLISANAVLDEKVKERTAELFEVNRSLIQEVQERIETEHKLRTNTEALERSNKELEQFAYVASHDLQEPLRKIASFTELLSNRYRGKALDEKADTFMAFIVDGARRMQILINDLLAFSRVMTQGREFVTTDCNVVLDQALHDLDLSIKENGATISSETLPVVLADQTQMAQLFQNLIGNAIKYHGEGPPVVHISAALKGQEWQFSISDNGIGIADEFFERIFLIFQRLHAKTEYSGTGIGLAVCKKIVERHGGRIWVESSPGKGSTFFFTIPNVTS